MRRLARHLISLSALAVLCLLGGEIARAVEPDEVLADPLLEQRARAISRELRCMVCQNESIDDSHAPLARDLRLIVRERLKEGAADQDIFDDLTRRYGDFVLLRPRLSLRTVLLWSTPCLVFLAGAALMAFGLRRREPAPGTSPAFSAGEERELARLLGPVTEEASLQKRNLPESQA